MTTNKNQLIIALPLSLRKYKKKNIVFLLKNLHLIKNEINSGERKELRDGEDIQ